MVAFVGTALSVAILTLASEVAEAQNVAELFGKVAPTVVVVRAKSVGALAGDAPTRSSDIGSGVVISGDGKVLTAAHLVHGAAGIEVQFLGGRTVAARVVALELAADLCLIQLDQIPPSLGAAKLANSDTVRVGEQVIVVGAPYGLGHTLSVGWIGGRWAPSTVYKAIPLAEFFQTDASINTGNSGGPTLPTPAWHTLRGRRQAGKQARTATSVKAKRANDRSRALQPHRPPSVSRPDLICAG